MLRSLKIIGLSFINLLNRIGGFLREVIIAFLYGATKITDIFYVASNIPNTFYFVVGNVMNAVIVPELSSIDKQKERNYIISVYLNFIFIISSLICLIVFIFSNDIIHSLSPGFEGDQLFDASLSLGIMIWSIPFLISSMYITGVLNTVGVFFTPGLSISVLNFSFIIILFFFYGLETLSYAFLVSSILSFIYCIALLIKTGFKYSLAINIDILKKSIRPIILLTLTFFTNQISFFVLLFFASKISDGVVSGINFANKLIQLPIGVFSAAIMTIVFANISKMIKQNENNIIEGEINNSLKLLFYLVVPITFFIYNHSHLITDIAFNRGNFTEDALKYTVESLKILSIFILTQSFYLVLTRILFAYKKFLVPLYTTVISVLVLLCTLYFSQNFSLEIILFLYVLTSLLNAVLLYLSVNIIFKLKIKIDKKFIKHLIFIVLLFVLDKYILIRIDLDNNYLTFLLISLFFGLINLGYIGVFNRGLITKKKILTRRV